MGQAPFLSDKGSGWDEPLVVLDDNIYLYTIQAQLFGAFFGFSMISADIFGQI
jgi:hypothetical protein